MSTYYSCLIQIILYSVGIRLSQYIICSGNRIRLDINCLFAFLHLCGQCFRSMSQSNVSEQYLRAMSRVSVSEQCLFLRAFFSILLIVFGGISHSLLPAPPAYSLPPPPPLTPRVLVGEDNSLKDFGT